MQFEFLDLVGVKGHEGEPSHEGCILTGKRSKLGETYEVQWNGGYSQMRGNQLFSIVPKR